jgi:hypothetical protein
VVPLRLRWARDVEAALAEALGPDATASKSTVSRVREEIKVHRVFGEIRADGPFLEDKLRILGYPVDAVPSAAGYRLGSDRGSPNHGSTPGSKRVMAQIRSPARVST